MIKPQNISVVVQGLVEPYTKLVLQSIRKNLPGAEIILSTWEGTNLDKLIYDKVVLVEDPGAPVCSHDGQRDNTNRQIIGVQKGIEAATRPYILRTRTDLHFKSPRFLRYFDRFQKRHPDFKVFKKRLLISSVFSIDPQYLDLPFHPSDWAFFGLKEDVKKMWDIPLSDAKEHSGYFLSKERPNGAKGTLEHARRHSPEQYNWISVLKKEGFDIQCKHFCDHSDKNILDSIISIINNFVVLSPYEWGFFSHKYDKTHFDIRRLGFKMSFLRWLKFYKEYLDPKLSILKTLDYYNWRIILYNMDIVWGIKHPIQYLKKIKPKFKIAPPSNF